MRCRRPLPADRPAPVAAWQRTGRRAARGKTGTSSSASTRPRAPGPRSVRAHQGGRGLQRRTQPAKLRDPRRRRALPAQPPHAHPAQRGNRAGEEPLTAARREPEEKTGWQEPWRPGTVHPPAATTAQSSLFFVRSVCPGQPTRDATEQEMATHTMPRLAGLSAPTSSRRPAVLPLLSSRTRREPGRRPHRRKPHRRMPRRRTNAAVRRGPEPRDGSSPQTVLDQEESQADFDALLALLDNLAQISGGHLPLPPPDARLKSPWYQGP